MRYNMIELPVKYDRRFIVREKLTSLGAKVIDEIEIKSGEYHLFIVDKCNVDRMRIIDVGFAEFCRKKNEKQKIIIGQTFKRKVIP